MNVDLYIAKLTTLRTQSQRNEASARQRKGKEDDEVPA